jgi:transposase
MVKSAHNLMAYNSQICVDDKFKFIVATDVTSSGTDKQELHHMAMQTKEVITSPDLVILADKGYYSASEIKKCVDDGIKTLVPAIKNLSTRVSLLKISSSMTKFKMLMSVLAINLFQEQSQ